MLSVPKIWAVSKNRAGEGLDVVSEAVVGAETYNSHKD